MQFNKNLQSFDKVSEFHEICLQTSLNQDSYNKQEISMIRNGQMQSNPEKSKLNFMPPQADKQVWRVVGQTFDAFDANKSGQLDQGELRGLLNFGVGKGIIKQSHKDQFIQYVKKIDFNKDGLVSKLELYHFIKGTHVNPTITLTRERSRSKEIKRIFKQPYLKEYNKSKVGTPIFINNKEVNLTQGRFIPSTRISPSKQIFQRNNNLRNPSPARSPRKSSPNRSDPTHNFDKQIENTVNEIFNKYDKNRTGQLDSKQLQGYLRNELHNKYNFSQFMNIADLDKQV